MTIGDGDGVGIRDEGEAMATSIGLRDEVARSATVDEHDCGVGAEGTGELQEESGVAGTRRGERRGHRRGGDTRDDRWRRGRRV